MLSFDSRPTVYFVIGYGLLWIVGLMAVSDVPTDHSRTWWHRRSVFLLLALTALVMLRIPVLVFNQELNPDESQMITQAMTLIIDPVFWRSVDGTTGGPLDSYLLILPHWLGLPFDFIRARLVGLGCILLSVWFFYRSVEVWFGERVARLALLPPLLLLSITQNPDFVHYSSEHLPVALLGALYLAVAVIQRSEKPTYGWVFLAGLLAGTVPFAKLQGVPMAFVAGLFILITIGFRKNLTGRQKGSRLLTLVAGSVFFPLFVVMLTLLNGVFDDFITFYIVGNFQYGTGGDFNWLKNLAVLSHLVQRLPEFYLLVGLPVLLGLVMLPAWLKSHFKAEADWEPGAFVIVLLAATVLAVTRTGSGYPHHMLFAVIPCALVGSWMLATCLRYLPTAGPNHLIRSSVAVITLLSFTLPFLFKLVKGESFNRYVQGSRELVRSDVAKFILQYARPGEPLVVWGWMCRYYVEAQMPQGVNENHSIRSAYDHPLKHIYLTRYVGDLTRSFPPVFVDAVGYSFWLNDRQRYAHEHFPALHTFIQTHYRFAGEIDKTRIYVRADRFKPARQLAQK